MHGKLVNGKFEWAWELTGGDFLRQNILPLELAVDQFSVHASVDMTIAGVDTIDAFCYS